MFACPSPTQCQKSIFKVLQTRFEDVFGLWGWSLWRSWYCAGTFHKGILFWDPSRAHSCCVAPGRREASPREHWAGVAGPKGNLSSFEAGRDQAMPRGRFKMLNASESGCKLLRAEICPFLGCGRDIYCTPWNRDPDYGCSCCSKNDKWDVILLRLVLFFLYLTKKTELQQTQDNHHLRIISVRKKCSHLWERSALPTAKLSFNAVV